MDGLLIIDWTVKTMHTRSDTRSDKNCYNGDTLLRRSSFSSRLDGGPSDAPGEFKSILLHKGIAREEFNVDSWSLKDNSKVIFDCSVKCRSN